ncbi:Malonyl-CoA decarboxylase family protein isoform 1 [Hibiscus syriacus]|uniref:Malonyl-CoA decarboxylase family protein isoform 1 n=1 Tax=Hibiscus syriacus TaxID=106335 RepID=A0A6A2XR42_HIBSY|nr:Malonyl-CoA decarboxylase family protein isoform 1 [Hibiscus syriacus]
MESLAVSVLPFPKPSFFHREKSFPSWPPCKQRSSGSHSSTRLNCHKMFVPGFGEASPETKASKNLHHFFNYIAVKIVSAQLESYNPEAYDDLMDFLETHSLNDGDEFIASLMRESPSHKALGMVCRWWMNPTQNS